MSIFFPPYQELLFLYSFLCGIALGVVYDVLAVKRSLTFTNAFVLFVDDLMFSSAFLLLFEFVIFTYNDGRVRCYELLFTLLGFLCYKKTVSKVVMFVFGKVALFIKSTLKRVYYLFFKLVLLLLSPLKYPLLVLQRFMDKIRTMLCRYFIFQRIFRNVYIDFNRIRM